MASNLSNCPHFWLIDTPDGPTSTGRCKYCGEVREMSNVFPTFNPLRRKYDLTRKIRLNKWVIDENGVPI